MSVSGPLLVICDGLVVKMLLQNLTRVCIPNHVRELENDCFRYCGNLSHVVYVFPSDFFLIMNAHQQKEVDQFENLWKTGLRSFANTSHTSILKQLKPVAAELHVLPRDTGQRGLPVIGQDRQLVKF